MSYSALAGILQTLMSQDIVDPITCLGILFEDLFGVEKVQRAGIAYGEHRKAFSVGHR
jgi:hypothetical protein